MHDYFPARTRCARGLFFSRSISVRHASFRQVEFLSEQHARRQLLNATNALAKGDKESRSAVASLSWAALSPGRLVFPRVSPFFRRKVDNYYRIKGYDDAAPDRDAPLSPPSLPRSFFYTVLRPCRLSRSRGRIEDLSSPWPIET